MFTKVEPIVKTFESLQDYTMQDLPDESEFRAQQALKYSQEKFPVWKRLGFSEFVKEKIEKYNGDFLDGKSKILENSEKALDEKIFRDLLGRYFYGVHPKFTLLSSAFFNTGFSSLVSGHGDIHVRYDLNKNPVVIENSVAIIENGSEATMIRKISGSGRLSNSTLKFVLRQGARLKLFNVFIASKTSLFVDSNLYLLAEGADLEIYDVIFGAQKMAIDRTIDLEGINSKAKIRSVYFGRGKERVDLRYSLNHLASKTYGRTEGNGILADEAYSVFRGNIDIKKDAYEADSEEKNAILNLSPNSRADSIPSLFVDNSTVTARHGSSVENIDEDKLYYLMSRGLDERSAIKLIVEGIFRPVIDEIPDENLKKEIENALSVRI